MAAQECDVAVVGSAAAREHDIAVAGGGVATAAGKFPPPYHTPAGVNAGHSAGVAVASTGAPPCYKPPPTDRLDSSVLLPVPTPAGQAPQPDDSPAEGDNMEGNKVFRIKKDWMVSTPAKERETAHFYCITVMQYIF